MIDFLLNTNIAYLLLVGGFSLTLLAVITPGTGVLEAAGIIMLLLAGWGVYTLPINYWALAILLLCLVLFVLALRKGSHWSYLGSAILTFVIGSVFLFRSDIWWQPAVNPVLAIVVSLLLGGFFWIAITKTLAARAVPAAHDLTPLIDKIGEAKSAIHHQGSVQVNRELWSARSNEPIPAGAAVLVLRRDGFVLEVEEVK
ncbi:MAG: hypothetical protein HN413_05705 [Chloroflexi bacterium]|jgi:membrane-bound serine protease (ClpP class)|nr:hypothetical protein [Chloroflexota bacterium]